MHSSFTSLIVTYNSAHDILDLLSDLYAHAPSHKVIVIDNASQDDTVQCIAAHFPQVQLICNDVNVGYAKAVNQGFDLCESEYVLLLNPDVRIPGAGVFRSMDVIMKRRRQIAAVAPLQFKADEKALTFTWSHVTLQTFLLYLSSLWGAPRAGHEPMPVTFLNAGCLFLRRSAFYQVGRFNEKYFLYGEEPDLFLKIKRHRYECYLLPEVHVIHHREHSLKTVALGKRLRVRGQAILNVADALIIGWSGLLVDWFTVRRFKKSVRN
jgi:GT2 family glycosyltransferase